MSYESLIAGTDQVSISFISPGVATLDPVTYEPVYSAGTTTIIDGNFINLSPSEISARQQIQDNSRFKLVIKDTVENRTITSIYTATIDGVVYLINGQPKHPQFSKAWITVYISKKES
jgi:hypothetical protein